MNILAQFFNDNEAFECLEVDDCSDSRLYALAIAMQRCDSLKEFKLTNEMCCDVIHSDQVSVDGVV